MKHTNLLLLLASSFLFACSGDKKNEEQSESKSSDTVTIVKPPIAGVDIEKEEFTVRAENGDTLYSKSGSIILFPKNSMVDENGTPIKGDVQISYREFTDPIDFFVSGIPMNYDSAGVAYDFKSAGMCELKATKDGKEVFVNQQSKPEINMVSNDEDPEFNLYYLDEKKKGWQSKGKDAVTNLDSKSNKEDAKAKPLANTSASKIPAEAPVKPNKVSDPSRVIEIEIAPGDYPELSAYNNVKFEIEKSEKFSPKDAEEEWNEVKVVKASIPGLYTIKFSNAKRKVSYKARPVMEGKDYAAALKVFEAKNKDYEKMLADRVNKENKAIAEVAKKDAEADAMIAKNKLTAAENARIDKMNVLIAARNKDIEATNKITLTQNKKIEAQNKVARMQKASYDSIVAQTLAAFERMQRVAEIVALLEKEAALQKSYAADEIADAKEIIEERKLYEEKRKLSESVTRSFAVDGFGIWNCDKPVLRSGILLNASFVDESGKSLNIKDINVVLKNFNGVVSYYNNNKITVPNEGKCAIFSVVGGRLAYIPAYEFENCKIDKSFKEYSFKLKFTPNKITSAEELRTLIEI